MSVLSLGGLALVLSLGAWGSMLAAYPRTQNGDGQFFLHQMEAARVSLIRYHELPLWNPYECAGVPLWDNPQSYAGAPLTWLSFALGSTATVYAWIVVHVALGFVGMWVLVQYELRLSRFASFVAAGAWAFSGFHQHHYSGGHLAFVPFVFFPFALFLWRRAENDHRHAVGLGGLMAWMFYEGGVYALPHLLVVLAAEALVRARSARRVARIASAAALVGVVAATLSASRLLPVLDQLRSHTRAFHDSDFLRWDTFTSMFLTRLHPRAVPGQQYVWTEYAAYLGPIVLLLALTGVVFGGLGALWLLLPLALASALMFGHFASWAPWHILYAYVPPYKEMRVPSWFCASVTMFLAVYAGLAVDRLGALAARVLPTVPLIEKTKKALVAVSLLGVVDIFVVGIVVAGPFFSSPPEDRHLAASARLYYEGPDKAAYIDLPRQNRGRLACQDEWGFGGGAPVWTGDVPQARALNGGAIVGAASRTQNTFSLEVDAGRPCRIALNTSYDRGWQASVGTLSEQGKLLVLDLPEGSHRVRVRYWPRLLSAGIGVTACGFFGLGLYVGFLRFAGRRTAAARRDPMV